MEEQYQVYKDMEARTKGEIYIGVVGPVRTGKSTFIKRFMDVLVLPNMEDIHSKERAIDELPQSAAGKMIMTTEPKFVPKDAAELVLSGDSKCKVRLIDCVGYMVKGASGHMEEDKERMVKTPWFTEEIPFSKAAEVGTEKVIREHSTIGVIVTTDGSFGELKREQYEEPEYRTVSELHKIGKPFVILLNSSHPEATETKQLAKEMEGRYHTRVLPMNCLKLEKEDLTRLMEGILSVFPIMQLAFYLPKWTSLLPGEHPVRRELMTLLRDILDNMNQLKDVNNFSMNQDTNFVEQVSVEKVNMETGVVNLRVTMKESCYYEAISEITGMEITGEKQLVEILKDLAGKREEYDKIWNANEEVRLKGYGVMTPSIEEIAIEEPELIRHGNKFGVKIKAVAPSVHLIKANIETEIAPIVGSEEQAKDLISYIGNHDQENPMSIWETNIFGKTIRQLIEEGIQAKVNKLTDESQIKLQDTMQKVVNDSNGGLVCIII